MATKQCAFVYGTLMYKPVLETLLHRVPPTCKAEVKGFRRYAITTQVFPGTIESTADSTVQGIVLFDLSPEDMYILDQFEGEEYYKTNTRATLLESCESLGLSAGLGVDVNIYIWQHSLRNLLRGEWDPEEFESKYLGSYLGMCKDFAVEVRENFGKVPENRPFGFSK